MASSKQVSNLHCGKCFIQHLFFVTGLGVLHLQDSSASEFCDSSIAYWGALASFCWFNNWFSMCSWSSCNSSFSQSDSLVLFRIFWSASILSDALSLAPHLDSLLFLLYRQHHILCICFNCKFKICVDLIKLTALMSHFVNFPGRLEHLPCLITVRKTKQWWCETPSSLTKLFGHSNICIECPRLCSIYDEELFDGKQSEHSSVNICQYVHAVLCTI